VRQAGGEGATTCLIVGIGREILAVVVCGQDDAPWRVWVFRRDDVREVFGTEWRRGYETVLFYVPIELAEGGCDIVADESMVFGLGCTSARFKNWKVR
jgi:hypothetical protein